MPARAGGGPGSGRRGPSSSGAYAPPRPPGGTSGDQPVRVGRRPRRQGAVKAGDTFTYPIAAKARHGPVTFHRETGPKGMEVSKGGVVMGRVPADTPPGEQEAILPAR